MYILDVIKNIFKALDAKAKKKYILLQLLFLGSALFQVAGIASIGPFVAIISNPTIIETNEILQLIYVAGDFETTNGFIIFAAIGSIAFIVSANIVAALTRWLTVRFSINVGGGIQRVLFRNMLNKDYIFHKQHNYSTLIALITQNTPRFTYMLLEPFLTLTSQLFVALLILLGLLILDPTIAIIAGMVVGGAYLLTYIYLRKSLKKHGEVVSEINVNIQRLLSESFIGIKDIKLGRLAPKYKEQFEKVNKQGLRSQAFISLAGDLPRFIIETISFGAILLLAVVLIIVRSDISSVVPILSIYALAGYRLLPTMQQIYRATSNLSGHGSVASLVNQHLDYEIEYRENLKELTSYKEKEKLRINEIELNEVCYSYPGSVTLANNSVSATFKKGIVYSIGGHSGSGKSTIADIILGLIPPDSGKIKINGSVLDQQSQQMYMENLSYVGQSIFILDDTVISNVAFGESKSKIDLERVQYALNLADAEDFVNALPNGLETKLGQDGKLLSGGQRQRIGIARALYKKSDLLVLDEPTSALDIDSEFRLMNTLNNIKEDMIIIVISHRPASIRMSDRIIIMSEGKIRSIGSYHELMEIDGEFKTMIEKSISE